MQNADDAGATNVIFLFDQTDHPTQRLWSESLNNVQGAALYAYNDAKFTDKDWTSIQNPSQSGKIDDLAKVGRFGLGFISVYHLTGIYFSRIHLWLGSFRFRRRMFLRRRHHNRRRTIASSRKKSLVYHFRKRMHFLWSLTKSN